MKTKALVALLLVFVMLATLISCTTPGDTTEGESTVKTITVKIVHKDKSEKTVTVETEANTLLGALQQEKLVEGEDQSAGFYITAVDGETADWSVDQGWWCFTKGGDPMMTGADSTVIADGDAYEITYTVGMS